jgi:hypothetical protein
MYSIRLDRDTRLLMTQMSKEWGCSIAAATRRAFKMLSHKDENIHLDFSFMQGGKEISIELSDFETKERLQKINHYRTLGFNAYLVLRRPALLNSSSPLQDIQKLKDKLLLCQVGHELSIRRLKITSEIKPVLRSPEWDSQKDYKFGQDSIIVIGIVNEEIGLQDNAVPSPTP